MNHIRDCVPQEVQDKNEMKVFYNSIVIFGSQNISCQQFLLLKKKEMMTRNFLVITLPLSSPISSYIFSS